MNVLPVPVVRQEPPPPKRASEEEEQAAPRRGQTALFEEACSITRAYAAGLRLGSHNNTPAA
jgi:hypothetical protein